MSDTDSNNSHHFERRLDTSGGRSRNPERLQALRSDAERERQLFLNDPTRRDTTSRNQRDSALPDPRNQPFPPALRHTDPADTGSQTLDPRRAALQKAQARVNEAAKRKRIDLNALQQQYRRGIPVYMYFEASLHTPITNGVNLQVRDYVGQGFNENMVRDSIVNSLHPVQREQYNREQLQLQQLQHPDRYSHLPHASLGASTSSQGPTSSFEETSYPTFDEMPSIADPALHSIQTPFSYEDPSFAHQGHNDANTSLSELASFENIPPPADLSHILGSSGDASQPLLHNDLASFLLESELDPDTATSLYQSWDGSQGTQPPSTIWSGDSSQYASNYLSSSHGWERPSFPEQPDQREVQDHTLEITSSADNREFLSRYPVISIGENNEPQIVDYPVAEGDPTSSFAFIDTRNPIKPLYFTNNRHDTRYASNDDNQNRYCLLSRTEGLVRLCNIEYASSRNAQQRDQRTQIARIASSTSEDHQPDQQSQPTLDTTASKRPLIPTDHTSPSALEPSQDHERASKKRKREPSLPQPTQDKRQADKKGDEKRSLAVKEAREAIKRNEARQERRDKNEENVSSDEEINEHVLKRIEAKRQADKKGDEKRSLAVKEAREAIKRNEARQERRDKNEENVSSDEEIDKHGLKIIEAKTKAKEKRSLAVKEAREAIKRNEARQERRDKNEENVSSDEEIDKHGLKRIESNRQANKKGDEKRLLAVKEAREAIKRNEARQERRDKNEENVSSDEEIDKHGLKRIEANKKENEKRSLALKEAREAMERNEARQERRDKNEENVSSDEEIDKHVLKRIEANKKENEKKLLAVKEAREAIKRNEARQERRDKNEENVSSDEEIDKHVLKRIEANRQANKKGDEKRLLAVKEAREAIKRNEARQERRDENEENVSSDEEINEHGLKRIESKTKAKEKGR